eukprot:TRINITY_DN25153_c0_g2_i1.p1 TRINITY_DN25153_c0_g2~~TRINITY_DN25153_c0_g2_i1.p1  ORF type:complete len:238 (-),score=17.57 TRINITY_DN25153_c0_g2_i1:359-1006(-)
MDDGSFYAHPAVRPRRIAAERRDQCRRVDGRTTLRLLSCFELLDRHRDGTRSQFAEMLSNALRDEIYNVLGGWRDAEVQADLRWEPPPHSVVHVFPVAVPPQSFTANVSRVIGRVIWWHGRPRRCGGDFDDVGAFAVEVDGDQKKLLPCPRRTRGLFPFPTQGAISTMRLQPRHLAAHRRQWTSTRCNLAMYRPKIQCLCIRSLVQRRLRTFSEG